MLFRKRLEKSCTYCRYGTILEEGFVLCTKRGIVSADCKCRKFCYDPIKRIPTKPKALNFEKYNNKDFTL
jgi:hypothetical protein